MSGQKKLERATRNIRVVAVPSRKRTSVVTDNNGNIVKDKNGNPQMESVQLYRIFGK